MKLFDGLEQIVRTNVSLAGYTWLGIGGPATYFIEPRTVEELAEVTRRCTENDVPIYVLGAGANLLVDDAGVKGAVIHLRSGQFTKVTTSPESITAGAGADIGKLVLRCVREGLSGLEALTGIPGTIGGAIRMNAGGKFGDIGSAVQSIEVMTETGEIFIRSRDELAFAYRSTNITEKFILSAEFRVIEDDPHRILKQVKQIWIYKKNTQPLAARNAGCVFKNPRGLSAGALIDRAGLKGRSVGDLRISDTHANFIIAEPGAKASDFLKLINVIREMVYKKSEVYLELEMEVW